jgi:hypothetical protein
MTADEIARIRAEALEEAARVADQIGEKRAKELREAGGYRPYLEGMSDASDEIAADIRALIPSPPLVDQGQGG